MKQLLNMSLLVIIMGLNTGIIVAQKTLEKFNYKGKDYSYIVQLPSNYDASKTYSVLVGPSEVKSITDDSFYWRGTQNTQGWILVSYKLYRGTKRLGEIKAFLEHLKATYKVKGNQFHTVCFSANSSSIFDLVMVMPKYFKGITGMAGNPYNGNKEKLKKLKGVKVQFVVGDKDTYWMKSAQKSHQLLHEAGVDTQIEIIKNGPHVMKSLIGKGFLDRASRLK